MGFNIGSFLGGIAPLVGGALFGPVGAAVGAAVGAGFAPEPRAAQIVGRATSPSMQFPAQMTSVVPVPSTVLNLQIGNGRATGPDAFGVQRRRVGLTGAVARGALGLFGSGVGTGLVVSEILGRARENSGQRVTRNKIIDSAKACGIELTADTFGLSESDVCKVIVAGRSRRRRGVSAADVRRTKRTLRFVRGIRKDLKAVRL